MPMITTCLISKDKVYGLIMSFMNYLCSVFGSIVLRVKQQLTSHFQFSIKVLKFESQVSFLTLLRYAQFPTSDYLVYL